MDGGKYWKYTGISVAQIFAGTLVLTILAPYFSSLGYSETWISAVFGLFPLVMVISSLLVGELSDEMGRTYLIRFALFGTVVAYSLYLVGWQSTIITGRVVDALSYSVLIVVLLAKIEDVVDSQSRGRYTGIYFTIRDGARVFGPILGGWLADIYIGLPFATAVCILFAAMFVVRSAHNHQKKEVALHPIRSLKRFFSNKQLRPIMVLGPVINALIPLHTVFLPLLITNELGLSYVAVGAATSAFMLGHLSQFFFGDLVDRFGERPFILLGSSLLCVFFMCIPLFGDTYVLLLVLMFFAGVFSAMWNVSCIEYLSDVSDEAGTRGEVLGTYTSIAKVGESVAYFTASALVIVFGLSGVFIALSAFAFVGVVVAAGMFARTA